jgi:hypothetical protein
LESAAEGSPLGFCGEQQSVSTLKEWGSYPNLGSKVLSLCLKRLLRDWESTWCHPLLVVESFVEEHYGCEGTCYKACGFEAVGLTVGYGRSSRDYYSAHARQSSCIYARSICVLERHSRRHACLRHGPNTNSIARAPVRSRPSPCIHCWNYSKPCAMNAAAMVCATAFARFGQCGCGNADGRLVSAQPPNIHR